jgi:hypothetical protein
MEGPEAEGIPRLEWRTFRQPQVLKKWPGLPGCCKTATAVFIPA